MGSRCHISKQAGTRGSQRHRLCLQLVPSFELIRVGDLTLKSTCSTLDLRSQTWHRPCHQRESGLRDVERKMKISEKEKKVESVLISGKFQACVIQAFVSTGISGMVDGGTDGLCRVQALCLQAS